MANSGYVTAARKGDMNILCQRLLTGFMRDDHRRLKYIGPSVSLGHFLCSRDSIFTFKDDFQSHVIVSVDKKTLIKTDK